jgi:hypothetical protein
VKKPFQLTIEVCSADFPPLISGSEGSAGDSTVPVTWRRAFIDPDDFAGKERQEIQQFLCFVQSDEFIRSLEILRPGAPTAGPFALTKNSDGDDPPDFTLTIAGGAHLGIELTDCSPIASMIAKISGKMEGPARIPAASDATNYKSVEEFMVQPESLVKPHFSSVPGEATVVISYLEKQIRAKDVSGNEVLLLTNSFMGGWPESEYASIAAQNVRPSHINRILLVSATRSDVVHPT